MRYPLRCRACRRQFGVSQSGGGPVYCLECIPDSRAASSTELRDDLMGFYRMVYDVPASTLADFYGVTRQRAYQILRSYWTA